MKVLVTGAKGMLGEDWVSLLRAQGHDVTATDRTSMDVTQLDVVRQAIGTARPDLVIHAAAHTNADQGEKEPDIPYSVNTIGTWNVVLACNDVGAQVAYVSSCGVFDGTNRQPYTELDTPAPLNHHHRSKWKAEQIVATHAREHFIFRPGWLFGGRADHERNFIAKRYREAQGRDRLQSADDRFGSPTYTVDFIESAMRVISERAFGTYHLVNQGACSRYEYVRECIDALGLATEVLPVDSSQFPREASMPVSEALDTYFLRLRGLPQPRSWQQALKSYVQERLLPELAGVS